MVSRFPGSITFFTARSPFCLGVSGRGVAVSRKRLKIGMSGWQLMIFSAGLEESGGHCERTPKMLGRAAGGTGVPPWSGRADGWESGTAVAALTSDPA